MKRMIALLLCACMLMSLAACGVQPAQKESAQSQGNSQEMSREDKELVAQLIGKQDGSNLSDEELDTLIDQLLEETEESGNVVNLSAGKKPEQPSVDVSENKDAYDENGAMTKPFDQVYPELIEKEQVAFSGESILVKMESSKLTDGLKAAGVGTLEKIVPLDGVAWYEAKLTEGTDAQKALEAVRELKEVLLAEYNYEVQTAALDDYKHFDKEQDEDFKKNGHNKDQWHFHHCGIVDGYEEMENAGGSSSVVVAVIDSGVDYTHEDLKDNMWVNTKEIPDNGRDDDGNGYIDDYYGVDIIARQGNGGDTNGHGTHVAGIIAAKNNNTGVLGVAYNVKIMSVKAAMHNGTLNQADIARAVLYAYEMGAQVINMSFGGTACSIAVQDALATAYTRCVLVASAGNNGAPNEYVPNWPTIPNYPAALTYVLGVMSVDENGVESAFTNWDVAAFNGVEYELYAPGENIMSTLPGNQYGYLSGTSMAAPVVSAFAAILRSEFSDPDMYPTKFIYGQLASTSEVYADCLDPKSHGPHNIPQVVDLNAALTKLPKPEVNLQDYAIFDDPKYSDKNNGDGVIDAGETIALGLTLRNRWGMSENTLVTIDTKSAISGLDDPYFTIKNPTVDYGSVGTYSTQDCGRVYTDELFTGWENPFLIEVASNCPNDYRFTLNVTITCENALDEADTAVYTTYGVVDENVRAGYILPAIIEEDMVLTPENLYIIPSATIITEGTTVTVMPGTHIQFWSDDADDPYADSYIAYLLVNGKFLVEGTKEDPVYIYPSQLMDHYGVEIGSSSKGYVSLKYADITNLMYYHDHTGTYNHIDMADHCTFRNNYGTYLYCRYLDGGVVKDAGTEVATIGYITAKDCVFYKLGLPYRLDLKGNFDRCVFTQCGIEFDLSGDFSYTNCVFLGNSLTDQTKPDQIMNSSAYVPALELTVHEDYTTHDWFQVYYREETGTTYVHWNTGDQSDRNGYARYLQKFFGGDHAKIETADELAWLNKQEYWMCFSGGWDAAKGSYVWYDGTPLDSEVFPDATRKLGASTIDSGVHFYNGKLHENGNNHYFFEIPGQILPEEITFREYAVAIDMESGYQLSPWNTPVQLTVKDFCYESADEAVVTVSDTGLITPVGLGTADVWVWSLDKAVRNRVTVTVKEYIPLEALQLQTDATELAVGENLPLQCTLTPVDTTRNNVIYSSSDEKIARVDAGGIVTGVSSGKVTITAACEDFTDTVELTVYQKATSLQLSNVAMSASLENASLELPEVVTDPGAELILSWRSTDPDVAAVENGKVVVKALGTTSLIATDRRSGLSAACLLMVSREKTNVVREIARGDGHPYNKWVLLENGSLYMWNGNGTSSPVWVADGVQDIAASGMYALLLKEDGTLEKWRNEWYLYLEQQYDWFAGKRITDIELTYYNIWVCTADGSAYAVGSSNNAGQLAIGSTQTADEPVLINLDGVVDIENCDTGTYFLTDRGELYGAGDLSFATTAEPVLLATDVSRILDVSSCDTCCFQRADGKVGQFYGYNHEKYGLGVYGYDSAELEQLAYCDSKLIGIRDGKVYTGTSDGKLTQVVGISNAVTVSTYDGAFYIGTADGLLLGFGSNPVSGNYMAGVTIDDPVKEPTIIPLTETAAETLTWTAENLVEDALTEEQLLLRFNKALVRVTPKLYADGTQVTVHSVVKDHNYLAISRSSGFAEGVAYELVFAPGTIRAAGGITNTEELRIAFTYQPGEKLPVEDEITEPTEPTEEKVVYESILDESVQRHWTEASLIDELAERIARTSYNPKFEGNVILNPISTDFEVSHWLRFQAPNVTVGEYSEVPLGNNYWGSTNDRAIGLQMIDYTDFPNYARLMYAPYLTEAPENTFPFVTSVKLFNKDGEEVTTVGNETVTFRITFNRDMDTSIPLLVRFGSAYPYGDYEFEGEYIDPRTWEGTYTLNTLIENGYQYFSISNGCSATDDLPLQWDQYRFFFEIDTTAAQALIMQGTATDTGIRLTWTQDDFDTLMGYNVYRSEAEDGYYTRLNKTVIPAETMEFFDDTVEPGKVYYYNFTVVQTDMAESEPSGKIVIMSKDTMAPNIYHSPVANAFTGANLVVDATITDNLNIAYANLYYRIVGTDAWKIVRMNKLNDKYSAIIPAQYVTVDGIEYYIEAFDGVSYTYKGNAETPMTIVVKEAIDANSLGDVDGDGVIANLDALLLLYAINDKYNMNAEQFARADLNGDGVLWAAEALRILQYVSGAVGSVKM